MAVFLFSLLIYPLWYRLAGQRLFDSPRRAFLFYTHPYLWGLAASFAVLLLGYDSRVDAGALWRPSVALLIALSVPAWAALLMGRVPRTRRADG
jgi:hypothetical protein